MTELDQHTYRRWELVTWLDDWVRTRAAPDALLTNGTTSMAVEIKRLTFIGHDFDVLVASDGAGRPEPFVVGDGLGWPVGGLIGWGEVTTTGLMTTDIGICLELTLENAAAKFEDADWADVRAVLVHMTPTGHWPDETITDTDYWSEEELFDALDDVELPEGVDLLVAATEDRLVRFIIQGQKVKAQLFGP